ncbi:MAG: NosD domain-containing protein, partial [Candidatus Thorarchaeota archaeon]
ANSGTDWQPRQQSPNSTVVDKRLHISQNLTTHDPIVINTVESFESQGWPGDGTQGDPFRISNLWIIGEPGLGDALIAIYSVPAHFVIENCWITGMGDTRMMSGIILSNVRNGIVQSCIISSTSTAIRLEYSEYNRFVNNTIEDSGNGIDVFQSTNNVIVDNYFETEFSGLHVRSSNDITIEDSDFVEVEEAYYYGYRLEIRESENIRISGCTVDGFYAVYFYESIDCAFDSTSVIGRGYTGFQLSYSEGCTFSNSTLIDCSVEISGWMAEHWTHQFQNVSVDGKLLGYFTGLTGATLDASLFSQLFILDSSSIVVENTNVSSSLTSLFLASSEDIEIRDVTLHSGQPGVEIELCQNLRFVNVFVNSSAEALRIVDSRNVNLDNCYFLAEWYGLGVENTTEFRLRNSTIITQYDALFLWYSSFAEISDNTIRSNGTSIGLYDSWNCSISRNSISGWFASLRIEGCIFLAVVDNTLTSVNVWLDGYEPDHWTQDFDNNTVNGKSLGYLNREMDTTIDIDEYGQLILLDCEGVIVSSGQAVEFSSTITIAFSRDCFVQDLVIDYEGESAIRIVSSDNCIIDSISLLNHLGPITIDGSQMIDITNSAFLSEWSWAAIQVGDSSYCNISYNNMRSGINIYSNQGTSVTYNTVSNGGDGISLWNSEDCDISDNTITNVWTGLRLGASSESIATGNKVFGCYMGISIDWSFQVTISGNIIESSQDRGITVWDSDDCIVSSNIITNSQNQGIILENSRNLIISWNVVMYNDGGGIWVGYDSSDNFIYGNLVSENSEFQGFDEGYENHWDDGTQMGNCWGTLLEQEVSIDGDSESTDGHPLFIETETGTLPIVSSPPDISVVFGNESLIYIHWVVWTAEPGAYTVFLNDARVVSSELDFSGLVGMFLSELSLGAHNFTISFDDNAGKHVTDTMFVHIVLVDASIAVSITTVVASASIFAILAVRELGLFRKRRSSGESLHIE